MIDAMPDRLQALWLRLSQTLGFVPGVIAVAFGAAGIALVEVDARLDLDGSELVFAGDADAARTVLSVIAGSLITVAGLTFSITIVVLQLTSSQFSPRILRTFFGDRVTQITIGTYVGIFVYALLVLRAVGSFGDAEGVPRLSVTLATVLGIGAVVLLVVFLHHVSQMIQVSHLTASVAHAGLAEIDRRYPEPVGEAAEIEDAGALVTDWHAEEPGRVLPDRPGFVARVAVDDAAADLRACGVERLVILARPGDFVALDVPIAEVWPAARADAAQGVLRGVVSIASERDLSQDAGFALRQLADTALRAMSPGINDPTTAVTCVGYLRSLLVRLAERAQPTEVRRLGDGLVAVVRARRFDEQLEALLQLGRYLGGDAWVGREVLAALGACAEAASRAGAPDRARAALAAAETVAEQLGAEARTTRDREDVERAIADVRQAARPFTPA